MIKRHLYRNVTFLGICVNNNSATSEVINAVASAVEATGDPLLLEVV